MFFLSTCKSYLCLDFFSSFCDSKVQMQLQLLQLIKKPLQGRSQVLSGVNLVLHIQHQLKQFLVLSAEDELIHIWNDRRTFITATFGGQHECPAVWCEALLTVCVADRMFHLNKFHHCSQSTQCLYALYLYKYKYIIYICTFVFVNI